MGDNYYKKRLQLNIYYDTGLERGMLYPTMCGQSADTHTYSIPIPLKLTPNLKVIVPTTIVMKNSFTQPQYNMHPIPIYSTSQLPVCKIAPN